MQTSMLDRHIRKPDARRHAQRALKSSASAYRRLSKASSPTTAYGDKKLRRDLRRASHSAAAAVMTLSAPPRVRPRDALAFGMALAVALIALATVLVRKQKRSEPNPAPSAAGTPAGEPLPEPLGVAEP